MSKTVGESLAEFQPESMTSKLLSGVLRVLPYSPEFPHYYSVADAVRQIDPNAGQDVIARAEAAANSDEIRDILWMAKVMDIGDSGYAVFTGVQSAVKFFFGDRSQALETDNQQRNDAVLKALGIAYMVYKAYPGSLTEKAVAFRNSPNGQAIALYYGSIEVALPFADNAMLSGGKIVGDMYEKVGAEQVKRLTQMAGSAHGDVGEATGMLANISGGLSKVVDHASNHIRPVADAARPFVPKVAGGADVVAGVVANAADVLPSYRLLGARLAAEAAALRALKG